MITKLIAICIIFISLTNYAYSQSDSTDLVSDSIIYVPETVVIKSTYYVLKTKKDSLNSYVGIGYSYGKSFTSPNTATNYSNVSSVNIYVGKKVRNLHTDIGVSIMSMVINRYTSFLKTKEGQTTKTVLDTIDTYYQIKNGVSIPVYVTESKDVTTVYTYQQDSTVNNKIRLTYLQIPFNITYFFSIKKLRIGPQLGVKPSFLITNVNEYSSGDIHTFMMYANAGFNVGYQASRKLIIEAAINHQFSLSKSSAQNIGTLPFQNLGLIVKYFL